MSVAGAGAMLVAVHVLSPSVHGAGGVRVGERNERVGIQRPGVRAAARRRDAREPKVNRREDGGNVLRRSSFRGRRPGLGDVNPEGHRHPCHIRDTRECFGVYGCGAVAPPPLHAVRPNASARPCILKRDTLAVRLGIANLTASDVCPSPSSRHSPSPLRGSRCTSRRDHRQPSRYRASCRQSRGHCRRC